MSEEELPLEQVFEKFDDALAFFRARTPLPAEVFYTLEAQARQKAFTVSNVAQLQVVQQVLDSLDVALDQGMDLESWRKEIGPALEAAWAGTVQSPAWRLETIFRTNVQTAFSHGRVRQLRDPAVTALRPFWLFDAVLDGRTTDECSARDGVLLPADDPWWVNNTPPIHFNALDSESLVLTVDGLRPIRALAVGELVATTRGRFRPVTAVLHKIVADATVREIRLESGRVLRGTHEHPVACRSPLGSPVWKRLGELKIGDQVLQHHGEASWSADAVGSYPNDGPPLSAEPSITDGIGGTPGFRVVSFPVDLHGNPLTGEREIQDVASHWMLGGSRWEDGVEVLLSWGEVAAEGDRERPSAPLDNPRELVGVTQRHAASHARPPKSPCPMVLSATLRDHLWKAAADGSLLALRSYLDSVALAPSREDCLPESVLAFELAKALASVPVLGSDKRLHCATVANVDSHASAVITAADARKPAWLCDISVEEDETYFADGIAVHNCRSGIRSLRKSQADRRGGVNPPDREVELNPPGKGFGAAPSLSPSVQVQPFIPEVTGHPALEGARLRKEREFAAAEEERRRQAALG